MGLLRLEVEVSQRAPSITDSLLCEKDGGKILGKLPPYRVAAEVQGLTQIPERIKYWLWCENKHWCLVEDPFTYDSDLHIHVERGQVKTEQPLRPWGLPEDYEDIFPTVPNYENGNIPTSATDKEWSKEFILNEKFNMLIAQLLGTMVAQKRGRQISEAQVLGLKRKFLRERHALSANDAKHWTAILDRKLAKEGLRTTEFWEELNMSSWRIREDGEKRG